MTYLNGIVHSHRELKGFFLKLQMNCDSPAGKGTRFLSSLDPPNKVISPPPSLPADGYRRVLSLEVMRSGRESDCSIYLHTVRIQKHKEV